MDLQPFNFRGHDVRVIVSTEGEPQWVGKDVCEVLEIKNHRDALSRLDPEGVGITDVPTLGGSQKMKTVSESGLYELIFQSRVPQAKEFRRWVTAEVLPEIRRHGMYATTATVEQMLADPTTAIKLLEQIKQERDQRKALEAQAAIDKPKVMFADAVAEASTDILVRDLAKILRGNGVDAGGNRLFAWLRKHKYLMDGPAHIKHTPTQKAMELGLFRIKETVVTRSDGRSSITVTPKVTGKGQRYFVERFLDGRFDIDDIKTNKNRPVAPGRK
ncbi:phage antirepressor [Corynebacterium belfantii]|uniref:phage antirepressor n=1 Tax=Corynebacterium belfantii TaxID=2014537 RepID=UPI00248AF94F|nr:phage antirepressor KilAC domain-containing protein [Corynebacterium belfantii]